MPANQGAYAITNTRHTHRIGIKHIKDKTISNSIRMALTQNWKKGDKYKCFILGEDTETFGPGRKIDIPTRGEFYLSLLDELSIDEEERKKEY